MALKVIAGDDQDGLMEAADRLRRGDVMIVPTDTNYAVVCSPFRSEAAARIYEMKQRDVRKPLSLFIAHSADWERWGKGRPGNMTALDAALDALWPGPFNIIVERRPIVPEWVTRGLRRVALVNNRCMPLNLLAIYSDLPLAATSANLSGAIDRGLVDLELAVDHVGAHVDLAIEAIEPPQTTRSSTIVDVADDRAWLVRLGDVSVQAVQRFFPDLNLDTAGYLKTMSSAQP